MAVSLAMIKNGDNQVENTIVADDNSFNVDGYYFIDIDGKFCQTGMYYNKKDGLFYYDEEFTKLVEVTTENI
jgi:hypothetical protein